MNHADNKSQKQLMVVADQGQLASLLDEYKMKRDNNVLDHLIAILGCRRVVVGSNSWQFAAALSTEQLDDSSIREALVSLLLHHELNVEDGDGAQEDAEMALLDGLLREGRWRGCLVTEDGAYALALALRKFSWLITPGFVGEDYRRTLKSAMVGNVLNVLNEWTTPVTPFAESVSTADLTRALFGDVWCDLYMHEASRAAHRQTFKLSQQLILSSRPAFVPGLLPTYLDRVGLPLPGLTG